MKFAASLPISGRAWLFLSRIAFSAGMIRAARSFVEAGILRSERLPPGGEACDTLREIWSLKGRLVGPGTREGAAAVARASEFGVVEPDLLRDAASTLLEAGECNPAARSLYLGYLSLLRTKLSEAERTNLERLRRVSATLVSNRVRKSEARKWMEQILARCCDISWAEENLGRIALVEEDYKAAANRLERAVTADPESRSSRFLFAFALTKLRRFADAIEHLNALLAVRTEKQALVLRALVLRALGDSAGAVRDLRLTVCQTRLSADETLVYIEVLLNSREADAALAQLDACTDKTDPRWSSLSAVYAETAGDFTGALRYWQSSLRSEGLAQRSATAILRIVNGHPGIVGGEAAMLAIPEPMRNGSYWIVSGNLSLAAGDAGAALESWFQVSDARPDLVQRREELALHYCATLYNNQQFDELSAQGPRILIRGIAGERTWQCVAAGICQEVCARVRNGAWTEAMAVSQLAAFAGIFRDSPAAAKLNLLRGFLLADAREYAQALLVLEKVPRETPESPEISLQLARCAFLSGTSVPELNRWWSEASADVRGLQLRSAFAAYEGEYGRAADFLTDLPRDTSQSRWAAAIFFGAGRIEDLLAIPVDSDEVRYYRAHAFIREGNLYAAENLLLTIEEEPVSSCARQLCGWLKLQECKSSLEGKEPFAAAQKLCTALRLWPGAGGAVDRLGDATKADVTGLLLMAGERRQLLSQMKKEAEQAGFADGRTCRNLALLHLSEGCRLLQVNQTDLGAKRLWSSIGYLGAALSQTGYITGLVNERSAAYRIDFAPEFANRAAERIAGLAGILFDAIASQSAQAGEHSRLSRLALGLRAELCASAALGKLGGLTLPRIPESAIVAGPIYIEGVGLDSEFLRFYFGLKTRRSKPPDLSGDPSADWLQQLFALIDEDDTAPDLAKKRELARLFSALRFPVTLQKEGQGQEALRELQRVRSFCPAMSGPEFRVSTGSVCAGDKSLGPICNLAYPGRQGARRFRRHADELAVTLLIDAGTESMAATPPQIASAIEAWREAISVAAALRHRKRTNSRIAEIVRGRLKVLQHGQKVEIAIELVEAALALLDDSDLKGELATLYAVRGVNAANEDRFEEGITDLERGYRMSPHLTYASENLWAILRAYASQVQDAERKCKLLRRAVEIGAKCQASDPHKSEYAQLLALTRGESAMAEIEAGRKGDPADLLAAFLAGTSAGGSRQAAIMFYNAGVRKANNNDWAASLRDLERAFELDSSDEDIRNAIARVACMRAVELLAEGRSDEAVKLIDKRIEADPNNQSLQHGRMVALLSMIRTAGQKPTVRQRAHRGV